MNTLEFLSQLRELDIRVWAEGDSLCYSAPEDGLPANLKAELARRKTEILAFLGTSAVAPPPIQRVPRDGPLPLSFGQQRYWFLDQLDPGNPAYHIWSTYRITGPLDVATLERAFNEIIRRHESLRTTFSAIEGSPVLVIAPSSGFSLPMVDLRQIPEGEHQAEVRRLAVEVGTQPFDLVRGPLFRIRLMRLAEDDFVLLLIFHHIITDGWSMNVLMGELSALYGAFLAGQPSPLPELPIQYADFAAWQREWLQGEVLERQLTYWRKQLGSCLPILELPTDRPRPPMQTHQGAFVSSLLSKQLTGALYGLSQSEGSTLFMILLAAFQVLLARYTGQDNILVGSPISGRDRLEVEHLIGFFLNTLVLRSDLSDKPSFRQLLQRVRETVLGAFTHQVIPFEQLVAELQPERSLSHTPVFQVLFVLQNLSRTRLKLGDVTPRPIRVGAPPTSMFDLTLVSREIEQGQTIVWGYNTDLFDAATIKRLSGHFHTLLEGIVADPDQSIAQLPLLSSSEKYQVSVEWNQTQADYHRERYAHELFEAQSERTPERTALVFQDQELSYLQLNQKANQLAHYLQSLGVGPEVPVGICVERSIEMIIGLLGILKAGGAYVPLDPMYPRQRLGFIIEDTCIPVLLTQHKLLGDLPDHQARVVCLDSGWERIGQQPTENPRSELVVNSLAYIIYTSGSAGIPKGVMIEHQSLANYVQAAADEFELAPHDRVLQFASISFDAAAEEVFPCLARGATLVLRTDEMLVSTSAFAQACEAQGVTILDLPTAYWHELVQDLSTGPTHLPVSLRLIIIGGEKALRERWLSWNQHGDSNVRLLNTYGPTEATIVATRCDLAKFIGSAASLQEVPIGRPIPNGQAYVLDPVSQLVPVGVPGELWLGGVGLARGYLDSPALTAARFIPDPFSGQPGARLYRTGDRVRFLADGNLQYLGRIDDQVKIRGFRVEPGEVEAVLLQHRDLDQVVVLAREDQPGVRRLVSYLVPAPGRRPSVSDLRAFLRSKLPEHMIPASYVMLDELPITTSGKVDRQALPAPDQSRPELDDTFVAPRTQVEGLLATIWREVLRIDRIGVHDSFFDLGGHSLLATRVVSQISTVLSEEVPLRSIFEAPTIAAMSQAIIDREKSPGRVEKTAGLLQRIKDMPAEERARILQQMREEGRTS